MKCSKCGSENVNVQELTVFKNKKTGCLYWLIIGWWLEPIMWLFLTLPWLIVKVFKPKGIKSKIKKRAICQSCGNSWNV